ncbi:MAG: hypothetical protein FJ086_12955 [Deltaproteobacteria bacterium]|nr:hypothetical protein [Deltaproteobacteria bacterium]
MLALLLALGWQFGGRLLAAAAGPEAELMSLLRATEKEGLSLEPVPGGPRLVSTRHHFDRVTVNVDVAARTAEAVATLDFEGRYGEARVSSLGLERVRFRYEDGRWVAEGGLAPTLSGLVRALELRRRALERGDKAVLAELSGGAEPVGEELSSLLAVTGRTLTVKAWLLRSERDEVVVSEEARLQGVLPDRPVDALSTRRLFVTPRGQAFLFLRGLL